MKRRDAGWAPRGGGRAGVCLLCYPVFLLNDISSLRAKGGQYKVRHVNICLSLLAEREDPNFMI